MNISPDVVIMTKIELDEKLHAAFQRGVKRGKFEADSEHFKIEREKVKEAPAAPVVAEAESRAKARNHGKFVSPRAMIKMKRQERLAK